MVILMFSFSERWK